MNTTTYFLCRNKKDISTFWFKTVPYLAAGQDLFDILPYGPLSSEDVPSNVQNAQIQIILH